MPDLPNVGWERDVESFREFFENPAFRTDGLKLYPTLVIRGTGLYELWKAGLYRNYDPALLIELVRALMAPLHLWWYGFKDVRACQTPPVQHNLGAYKYLRGLHAPRSTGNGSALAEQALLHCQ